MKNVITPKSILRILGIIACAAVIITMTACSGTEGPAGPKGPAGATGPAGPQGPSNVYTVTFLTGANTTPVPSQKVLETQFPYDPSNLVKVKKPIPTPTTAGLWVEACLIGWKKQQSAAETEKVYDTWDAFYNTGAWKGLYDFYSTPITSNLTLVPVWVKEQKKEISPFTVQSAVNWLNDNGDGSYLLAVNTSATSGMMFLDKNNVDLTIVGIGANPTVITLNVTGNDPESGSLFTLGKDTVGGDYASENISLTIGKNITLKGITSGTDQKAPLVQVNPGATFTMLTGSTISDNKNNNLDGGTGAVTVNGGTFIMKGGTIKDITGISTVIINGTTNQYGNYYGSFVMNGGAITGSTMSMSGTGITGIDVFFDSMASFDLSGNTSVSVGMVYFSGEFDENHPANFSPLSIDPSWSGALKLYLMGGDATNNTAAKVAKLWNGKTIVDTALSATQAAKITLEKLVVMTGTPIIETAAGTVSTAGVLTITTPTPAP